MDLFLRCSLVRQSNISAPTHVFKHGQRFMEPRVYAASVLDELGAPIDVVVKDYSRYQHTPHASLARFMVTHECNMLDCMHGLSPRVIGRTSYLLIMEQVKGRSLGSEESPEVMEALEHCVRHMHARNVVHNDLHASNIMVKDDGQIVVLDLASAMHWPHSTLLSPLRARDLANVAKIKRQKSPQTLTATDRRRLKKPLWARLVQHMWYRVYRSTRLHALHKPHKKAL